MNGVFIDSCILLDLFTNDPDWADWSENILEKHSQTNTLFINSIVYTEVSIGFNRIEELEEAISQLGIKVIEIPREALFLTGKTFLKYRKNKVSSFELITRDLSKFSTYFPQVKLIHP